eukprot:g2297.t1
MQFLLTTSSLALAAQAMNYDNLISRSLADNKVRAYCTPQDPMKRRQDCLLDGCLDCNRADNITGSNPKCKDITVSGTKATYCEGHIEYAKYWFKHDDDDVTWCSNVSDTTKKDLKPFNSAVIEAGGCTSFKTEATCSGNETTLVDSIGQELCHWTGKDLGCQWICTPTPDYGNKPPERFDDSDKGWRGSVYQVCKKEGDKIEPHRATAPLCGKGEVIYSSALSPWTGASSKNIVQT